MPGINRSAPCCVVRVLLEWMSGLKKDSDRRNGVNRRVAAKSALNVIRGEARRTSEVMPLSGNVHNVRV